MRWSYRTQSLAPLADVAASNQRLTPADESSRRLWLWYLSCPDVPISGQLRSEFWLPCRFFRKPEPCQLHSCKLQSRLPCATCRPQRCCQLSRLPPLRFSPIKSAISFLAPSLLFSSPLKICTVAATPNPMTGAVHYPPGSQMKWWRFWRERYESIKAVRSHSPCEIALMLTTASGTLVELSLLPSVFFFHILWYLRIFTRLPQAVFFKHIERIFLLSFGQFGNFVFYIGSLHPVMLSLSVPYNDEVCSR